MGRHRGPRSNTLIGIAGVHYVVMELSRRGLIALPTIRNTAGYDVIAATTNGKSHANIQVKTSSHPKVSFWPVASKICNIRKGPDDYYVFVEGLGKSGAVHAYLLRGGDVVKEIQEYYKGKVFKGGKRFPYCLHPKDKTRKTWESAWNKWNLV